MTQLSGSTQQVPLVIAGDFNSLPGSDPHSLLANGGLQPAEDPTGLLAQLPLRHAFPLRSAMATVGAHVNASAESHELQKMEPPYTNFTAHFVGTLDYVWYTMDRLSLGGLLEMVDDRQVLQHTFVSHEPMLHALDIPARFRLAALLSHSLTPPHPHGCIGPLTAPLLSAALSGS